MAIYPGKSGASRFGSRTGRTGRTASASNCRAGAPPAKVHRRQAERLPYNRGRIMSRPMRRFRPLTVAFVLTILPLPLLGAPSPSPITAGSAENNSSIQDRADQFHPRQLRLPGALQGQQYRAMGRGPGCNPGARRGIGGGRQSLRRVQWQSRCHSRSARAARAQCRAESPYRARAEPSAAERRRRPDDQSFACRATHPVGDETGIVPQQLPVQARREAGFSE